MFGHMILFSKFEAKLSMENKMYFVVKSLFQALYFDIKPLNLLKVAFFRKYDAFFKSPKKCAKNLPGNLISRFEKCIILSEKSDLYSV